MGRTQNSYPKTNECSFTFMFTLGSNGVFICSGLSTTCIEVLPVVKYLLLIVCSVY